MASSRLTFTIVVGLENYLIECVQPIKAQGEAVPFGEPAYIMVGASQYWAHFDPDSFLEEGAEEPEPLVDPSEKERAEYEAAMAAWEAALADAVEAAAKEMVPVRMVGFGKPSQVVLTEGGFDFEREDEDGEVPTEPEDTDDQPNYGYPEAYEDDEPVNDSAVDEIEVTEAVTGNSEPKDAPLDPEGHMRRGGRQG